MTPQDRRADIVKRCLAEGGSPLLALDIAQKIERFIMDGFVTIVVDRSVEVSELQPAPSSEAPARPEPAPDGKPEAGAGGGTSRTRARPGTASERLRDEILRFLDERRHDGGHSGTRIAASLHHAVNDVRATLTALEAVGQVRHTGDRAASRWFIVDAAEAPPAAASSEAPKFLASTDRLGAEVAPPPSQAPDGAILSPANARSSTTCA